MLHRSREREFRSPFGAVPAGAVVELRVRLTEAEPGSVVLRLWSDDGETRIPMRCEDGGWWWAPVDTSGAPRLIWYWFERMEGGRTACWYGANPESIEGGGAACGHEPESFQITVYDPAYRTPEWMKDGAMYQIMVDRFAVGRKGSYLARREDIVVHEDWHEMPFRVEEGRTPDNKANDFFGGNLPGILEELPYLKRLGINVLYLNPVFRANSNHKYDTGDYKEIDPTFGDKDEFRLLCAEAKKLGMRILLDGVFSHTGEDSRYFNRYGRYPDRGAYQSLKSPYASWYRFKEFPDDYDCWWDVPTLPNVNEDVPSYLQYMINGRDAVARKWIKAGASGWRLDVADELPDVFLDALREQVKRADPDAAILGEVWEDASRKISYGEMRRYLLGGQLDSVMNYPLRRALIDFLTGIGDAANCAALIAQLQENYPRQAFYSLMNHMGTHDRARIVNRLSGAEEPPKAEQREARLTPEQRALGLERTRAMWLCICALPGMPSIYYADEAGLEGWLDPFNRAAYPWGREDAEHLAFFRKALALRNANEVLRGGELRVAAPSPDVLMIERWTEGAQNARAVFAINRNGEARFAPVALRKKPALASREGTQRAPGGFTLPPRCAAIWMA